jgi:hypothetical protein
MIEPEHCIEIGGVKRRLRYRVSDWFRAERASGIGLRSGYGVPIASVAQMVPMLLFVGILHENPRLTLDSAADLIGYEQEDEIFEACVKAVYDYDPVSKKKLEALAEATKETSSPNPELMILIELIRSITTTASGPSQSIAADSPRRKSKT